MSSKGNFILALAAAVCIGIGGCVYMSCESKVVGAVLFSVALLTINYLGLNLFTGKVGYLAEHHEKPDIIKILVILFGNLCGTIITAVMAGIYKPALVEKAISMCEGKLMLDPLQALIAGIFCGVMMYCAVEMYRAKQTPVGIVFCVPVFILSGFEHSIADMFYFFTAGIMNAQVAVFLAVVVIGNAIGGMLIPGMKKLAGE